MSGYVLGLDIGITSVGYGVIDIDNNLFVDYGVRLFKEGTAAENETRRTKRGSRRLKRRKSNRLNDMKNLLKENELYFEDYRNYNPYEVRVKGLKEKLLPEELCTAIMHITKSRGTTLEALADESQDDEGTKATLSKNAKELNDGKYICEVQLDRLNKDHKVRGTENNFKTEDYVKELKEILKHQDLNEELCDQIIEMVSRRRRYDQGPGSEKSPTPYGSYRMVDGVLKHVNLIDEMRGRCSVYPNEFRAPKQSYTAELFNLLNDLNNLTIKGEKITVEEKEKVVAFVNEKGNITGERNHVTYMGPSSTTTPKNGLVKLELDNELIQGATVEVEYEIKVTNNSELDYVSEDFYKYGIKSGNEVTITPTSIIDYLDKNWGFEAEKNKEWTVKSLDEIKNIVAKEVYENEDSTIADKTILYTESLKGQKLKPTESATVNLNVSKVLSNSDEISLDNESEITELTKDGGSKLISTPGNYIPGQEETKESDESIAETVIVTPSTGANLEFIVPIMIGVIALVILGAGVVIIKKKTL